MVSAKIRKMSEKTAWVIKAVENVSFNVFSSFNPSPKVRKREVAPVKAPLIIPINTTTPPTRL